MADTHPDTDKILADIRTAISMAAEVLDQPVPEPASGRAALKTLIDQTAYLFHVLGEGGPLPAEWADAQQLPGTLGDLCEQAYVIIANSAPEDPAKETNWRDAAMTWRAQWFAVLAGAAPAPDTTDADIALHYLTDAAAQIDAATTRIDIRNVDSVNEDWAEVIRLAAALAGFVRDTVQLGEQGQIPIRWLRARYNTDRGDGEELVPWEDVKGGLDAAIAAVGEADTRPPGFWGRIELPGYRAYTGWIASEERFGQQMAVVRDWDGRETATVIPGPNSPIVHLPTPLRRPGPDEGDRDPFGEGFGSEYRQQDPY